MSPDFRIALLALGAVLLLAAVFGGLIFRSAPRTRVVAVARAVLGAAGAGLIAWILAVRLATPIEPAPARLPASPSPDARRLDLIGPASSALADCPVATAPTLPDGATATLKQMTTARAAFSAYDAATNNYTRCVDEMVARVARQATGSASQADLQALSAFAASAHNTAVDQEQTFANQFNGQVRAYNAKHPKP
jgi:hypothetical protein